MCRGRASRLCILSSINLDDGKSTWTRFIMNHLRRRDALLYLQNMFPGTSETIQSCSLYSSRLGHCRKRCMGDTLQVDAKHIIRNGIQFILKLYERDVGRKEAGMEPLELAWRGDIPVGGEEAPVLPSVRRREPTGKPFIETMAGRKTEWGNVFDGMEEMRTVGRQSECSLRI